MSLSFFILGFFLFKLLFKTHNMAIGSLIYIASNLLTKAIPFLILPILTHYLSVSDYGTLSIIMAAQGILINIFNFSQPSYINLSLIKNSEIESRGIISIAYLTSTALFIFIVIASSFLNFLKFSFFNISFENILILLCHALFCTYIELYLAILKAKKKSLTFGAIELFRTCINLLLSVFFIVIFKMNWLGRLYGMFFSSLLAVIYVFYSLYKSNFLSTIKKSYLKSLLVFCLPLIPHSISNWIIASSDRIMISNYLNIESNAIYTFAYQISTIVFIIGLSINYAWQPFLYEKLKNGLIKNSFKYYLLLAIIIIVFSLTLSFMSPYLIPLVAPSSYSSSTNFIDKLIFSNIIMSIEMFLLSYLFYYGLNKFLLISTTTGAALNILLNHFLLPIKGLAGAVDATLYSYCVSFGINLIILFCFIVHKCKKHDKNSV